MGEKKIALTLGLSPADPGEAARIPLRKRVQDVYNPETKSVPSSCVYVGRGYHSHRLPTTKWASKRVPGHDVSQEEWVCSYLDQISTTLYEDLPELVGRTLICDCPWQDLCEADLLAGLVFEATTPPDSGASDAQATYSPTVPRKPKGRHLIAAMLTGRVVQLQAIPIPTVWFSQEAVVLAFRKLFPDTWFSGFKFPFVEDILNASPFLDYYQWKVEVGGCWEGPQLPTLAPSTVRLAQRYAEGQQAGALSHRAALPPLLQFGLSPDDHFVQARERAQLPLPTEQFPVLNDDLLFAAWATATWRGHLRNYRQCAIGALRELKSRWAGVSQELVKHQVAAIRQVTATRDIGLLSLLILICSWGDTSYPHGLIKGLPAVGFAPPYGIFPIQPAECLTQADVLEGWEFHNKAILTSLRPGKDDSFLLSQSIQDAEQGFCSFPMRRADFLKAIRNQPHRLIPRCVITQSSGKQRIIDNADTGGQSSLSSDANKLVLCSPLRVAHHVAAAMAWLAPEDLALATATDSWETGGEDWPNAYRHSPMSAAEAAGCVVTFWHEEWSEPAYQLYTGLLFGLPLAVTSFNRYSRLVEALGRRFTFVLVSMYFDDATLTDWASSKGSGQFAFEELKGTPFVDEKKQPMAPTGTFLGLDHDLSRCMSDGVVHFWARERLQSKMLDIINTARATGCLTPGTAAKLYGVANFFEQGVWGRVGAGGLAAIKERQYSRGTSLTPELLICFEFLEAVISIHPRRQLEIVPTSCQRFCVASDAALEAPRQGTGGFLIVWFDPPERREAFVSVIPDQLYDVWGPGDRKIAQLEMLMILFGLIARPHLFRNRRGIWFIDNVAALMCLIRGRSENPDLEHIANMVHAALFALHCWCFWEWIPSKSNWSDSISRLGAADPWYRSHSFSFSEAFFPTLLWYLPLKAYISVFEYL